MKPTSIIICAVVCLISVTDVWAQDSAWETLRQNGALIDVPRAFLDYPINVVTEGGADIGKNFTLPGKNGSFIFYVASLSRPYERAAIAATDPTSVLTYKVDKQTLGVASGYWGEDRDVIFYSMCKTRSWQLHCFALTYPSSTRDTFDPIVERLASSLR